MRTAAILKLYFRFRFRLMYRHAILHLPAKFRSNRTIGSRVMTKHVVWAIQHENRFNGSTWAHSREKKDRTGQSKKSQGGNISPIWGEAPTVPIETKFCIAGNLPDVIMCAKFQDDIFRGYNFTGRGRISHFSYWFLDGPYNSAARLRCLWSKRVRCTVSIASLALARAAGCHCWQENTWYLSSSTTNRFLTRRSKSVCCLRLETVRDFTSMIYNSSVSRSVSRAGLQLVMSC